MAWKTIKSQEFFPSPESILYEELASIFQVNLSIGRKLREEFVPNSKQAEFFKLWDNGPQPHDDGGREVQTILCYGSAGSGKTKGVIAKCTKMMTEWAGCLGGVFRRTYAELFDSVFPMWEEFLIQYDIPYHRRLDPPELALANGSRVIFRSTEKSTKTKEGKADTLGGVELSFALMEEADEIKKEFYITLKSSRMRQHVLPRNVIFITLNPSSEEGWIYSTFEDLLKLGPGTYSSGNNHAVHMPVDANVMNVGEAYIANMEEALLDSPSLYRKWRLGLFGPAIQGKPIFGDLFDMKEMVSLEEMSKLWDRNIPLLRAWDFGWRRPACVIAQDNPQTGQITWLWAQLGHNELLRTFAERQLRFHKTNFPGARWLDFADIEGKKKNPYTEKTQIQILQGFRINPQVMYTQVEYGLNIFADQLSRRLPVRDGRVLRHVPAMRFCMTGANKLIEAFDHGYVQDTTVKEDKLVPVKDGYYEHMMDAARYIIVQIREMEARAAPREWERRNWKKIRNLTKSEGSYYQPLEADLGPLDGRKGHGMRMARYGNGRRG